ncbi:LacI family DNA-binding transcriptional regulator [Altericroceibacterium endophyticum]|uniref:LacI family DNA-binding transcriptional regulator n=1 Tax=Altericroceibacterium endophyticum TaxID=1808508 RepID=A0A6I4T2J3_9SPHN|nr:LacI family DNA-binding transcriptional regulator [Altericroceibacterium endophyticum]MXO64552.1 LacI family DNA-binding transcriptional regulator [Altericroceibacterium endophyticum]
MRKPTIKDIASHAGVSFKTVSRVINQKATVGKDIRAKVEASVNALGYRPNLGARSLRTGRSFTLALLMTSRGHVDKVNLSQRMPSYIMDVVAGLLQACMSSDYHLVVDTLASMEREQGEIRLARFLDLVKPDGVILIPPFCDVPWVLDLIGSRSIGLGRLNPGKDIETGVSMWIDNRAAGRDVGEAILAQGHRRIGYISGPETHYAHLGRLDGLREAVKAVRDAELVTVPGNFTYDSGVENGRKLLSLPVPPTAIFAANDEMAAGVLASAIALGISVPRELSLVGFGNLVISQHTIPSIATVSQPTTQMACAIGQYLVAESANDKQVNIKPGQVPYEFIRRASLGPAPSY